METIQTILMPANNRIHSRITVVVVDSSSSNSKEAGVVDSQVDSNSLEVVVRRSDLTFKIESVRWDLDRKASFERDGRSFVIVE
jgi:outer membrane lipopolysaccharide assembly protein LptE/RlpB